MFSRCSSLKYREQIISGKEYCYCSDMLGKSIIRFIDDSTFVYSERDSLFVSIGNWHIDNDKKHIILIGKDDNNMAFVKASINVKVKKQFEIVNSKKLKDCDDFRVFTVTGY